MAEAGGIPWCGRPTRAAPDHSLARARRALRCCAWRTIQALILCTMLGFDKFEAQVLSGEVACERMRVHCAQIQAEGGRSSTVDFALSRKIGLLCTDAGSLPTDGNPCSGHLDGSVAPEEEEHETTTECWRRACGGGSGQEGGTWWLCAPHDLCSIPRCICCAQRHNCLR